MFYRWSVSFYLSPVKMHKRVALLYKKSNYTQIEARLNHTRQTPASACHAKPKAECGGPGRVRTCDQAVMSRLL